MNLDKKVKIMQQMIDDKDKQIAFLKEENERLKSELELGKSLPKEGYEKAKKLIQELENKVAEQTRINEELKKSKEEYNKNLEELLLARKNLETKIDSIHKVINKCAI